MDLLLSDSLCISKNGWTHHELGLLWMVKDFDRQTKEKAAGRTRALLMDGHSSHYSLELIHFARANNIIILGYPPHCTHVLQGLDVVCFAKMKHQFRAEIKKFENLHCHGVTKEDFAGVFGQAFLQAFDEDTVKAAFSATGVWPYNPDVLRHGRDVHPMWVKSSIETLSNTMVRGSEYKGKVRRGL